MRSPEPRRSLSRKHAFPHRRRDTDAHRPRGRAAGWIRGRHDRAADQRIDQYGDNEAVVDGPDIWFVTESGDALVRIDLLSRKAELLPVVVPTAAHRPSPVPPPGVDLHELNTRSLETMRAELLGGWREDDRTRHSFISGVEFESIELDGGDFPDASIVATFRSVHRPGARFGIRWYLYDELGRPKTRVLGSPPSWKRSRRAAFQQPTTIGQTSTGSSGSSSPGRATCGPVTR